MCRWNVYYYKLMKIMNMNTIYEISVNMNNVYSL